MSFADDDGFDLPDMPKAAPKPIEASAEKPAQVPATPEKSAAPDTADEVPLNFAPIEATSVSGTGNTSAATKT